MSVSSMERCNGNVGGITGVWRGVTAVSTLRDDLTYIVSVRKYDHIFLNSHFPILFQPFFLSASFYQKI